MCSSDLSMLRESPAYDVVVMNRDAGDRSADELASAIGASAGVATPRLVLLSTRRHAREPNPLFSAELTKPVRVSELCDALCDVLSSNRRGGGRAPSRATSPATIALASRRVLVVDDNEVNRFVASEHLQQRGYVTDQAVDGREAFEKFEANEYACLLMDCQMPVMDGYAATRAIRDLERATGRERTPIIALTAHALAGERERVLAAGMDDFLSKPFRPSVLDGILRRYCERDPAEDRASEHHPTALDASPHAPSHGLPPGSAPQRAGTSLDLDPEASRSDKLIRLFLERLPVQLSQLGQAVEAGDAAQVRAHSHKIKGSSLALAAQRMSETAADMQHQAEEGNLAPLPLGLLRLKQQYGVVAELLKAELARRAAPSGASASRDSIT